MRTTLTIDDDVAAALERERRQTHESLKQTVNRVLRAGLAAPKKANRKRFVVTPIRLELPPGLSFDNVEDLIEQLEGPFHK